MKILVMGAGGVGGYFGGRLAAAGNDVTFVARGAHLAAIRRDGLVLDSVLGKAVIRPAKAIEDPAAAGVPEVVLLATKMTDLAGAARQLAPVACERVTIVTFQNGVEAHEMARRELPGAHVVPGVARIGTHIARPGVIDQMSPFARIEFGEEKGGASPRLEAFHAACKAAGIDAVLARDIGRSLWLKFGMLASFSGMAALTGHTSGPLRTNPRTRGLLEAAVREAIMVGNAEGGFLTPDDFPALMGAIDEQPPAMTSSMAHDRRAGKPLEVDYLSGAVVRLGARHGVPTPTHAFIRDALAVDAAGRSA
jgi:2-dehydropantoate 2-reductase